MNYAKLGTVSHGTLNTEHLLRRLSAELAHQLVRNPEWCAENPEDAAEYRQLIDEAGTIDPDSEEASYLLNEDLFDALDFFAPPYACFTSNEGDGADFGFWPMDIESIKEEIDFSSSKETEYPPSDYVGEWLHINERGNCTLYTRGEDGKDTECWSIV